LAIIPVHRQCYYTGSRRSGASLEEGDLLSLNPVIVNFVYATLGGVITLVFMWVGYKLFDVMTKFSITDELAKDNRAVGFMVMGIFIGVGVAMGLVVGLSLN